MDNLLNRIQKQYLADPENKALEAQYLAMLSRTKNILYFKKDNDRIMFQSFDREVRVEANNITFFQCIFHKEVILLGNSNILNQCQSVKIIDEGHSNTIMSPFKSLKKRKEYDRIHRRANR